MAEQAAAGISPFDVTPKTMILRRSRLLCAESRHRACIKVSDPGQKT